MAEAPKTNHHSLKLLAKSILNRLENRKFIVFNPKDRGALQEELVSRLSRYVLTEEDITNQVRGDVHKASEAIADSNIAEQEAFQSQKRALRARYEDNAIHGFYLKDTLRNVCVAVGQFLFDSSHVEDVFESDEAIHRLVMETIQQFDETKIA
jgi:hypothetical protein